MAKSRNTHRITFWVLLLLLPATGLGQNAPYIYSLKNENSSYSSILVNKIASPDHIKNEAAIPAQYMAYLFLFSNESQQDFQLIKPRIRQAMKECREDAVCTLAGFANQWADKDYVSYSIFLKYLPSLSFNLKDTDKSLHLLTKIIVDKVIEVKTLGAGTENISILPRKAQGQEFLTITARQRDEFPLASPITFEDKLCSIRLTFSSEHYSAIDIDTLPDKVQYVITVSFVCLTTSDEEVIIKTLPFVVEI